MYRLFIQGCVEALFALSTSPRHPDRVIEDTCEQDFKSSCPVGWVDLGGGALVDDFGFSYRGLQLRTVEMPARASVLYWQFRNSV